MEKAHTHYRVTGTDREGCRFVTYFPIDCDIDAELDKMFDTGEAINIHGCERVVRMFTTRTPVKSRFNIIATPPNRKYLQNGDTDAQLSGIKPY